MQVYLIIVLVYIVYFVGMAAFDVISANLKERENNNGEEVDISESIASYKPTSAKKVFEKEKEAANKGKPNNSEGYEDPMSFMESEMFRGNASLEGDEMDGMEEEGDDYAKDAIDVGVSGAMTAGELSDIFTEQGGENFFSLEGFNEINGRASD